MKPNALMGELGSRIQIPDLKFDDNNVSSVIFDDSLKVEFETLPDGKTLFLHSVVGVVPPGVSAAFYARLLSANLFGVETGRAVLALDKDQGEVMLFQRFNVEDLEYADFEKSLEEFLARLEYWKNLFETGKVAAEESGNSSSFMPGGIRG